MMKEHHVDNPANCCASCQCSFMVVPNGNAMLRSSDYGIIKDVRGNRDEAAGREEGNFMLRPAQFHVPAATKCGQHLNDVLIGIN